MEFKPKLESKLKFGSKETRGNTHDVIVAVSVEASRNKGINGLPDYGFVDVACKMIPRVPT